MMTKDDALKLAQEAYEKGQSDLMEACQEAAVSAMAFAVAAEREACAKVCDDWPLGRDDVHSIAAAIRARGER